jgi:hypothetical protein
MWPPLLTSLFIPPFPLTTTKRRPTPCFAFDCRFCPTPLSSLHCCPSGSMAVARAQRRIPHIHPSTPVDTQGRGARYDAAPLLLPPPHCRLFFPSRLQRKTAAREELGGGAARTRGTSSLSPCCLPQSSPRSSSPKHYRKCRRIRCRHHSPRRQRRRDRRLGSGGGTMLPPPRLPHGQNDAREMSRCRAAGGGGGKRMRMPPPPPPTTTTTTTTTAAKTGGRGGRRW